MNKKIIFISHGDSNDASSWSNIPFLFSKTLKEKGYDLVRVNIEPNAFLNEFWKKYIYRYSNIIFPNHQYSFVRSVTNHLISYFKIGKAILKNKDAFYCIFLTYDYHNIFNKIPSLLLSDWTYEMVISQRLKRKPYFFEKWFINYQKNAIVKSELVISLFKDCAEYITLKHHKNVLHLGNNVINDLNFNILSEEHILANKTKSNSILFIGTPKYLTGAKKLLSAFKILQKKYPELQLNMIGIKEEELFEKDELVKNVNCFGYLKKDVQEDNKTYYNLLTNAKVLVNPSEIWAAYSSSIEAMKYFTPVIIKPYEAFVKDFGAENDFGYYLENTEIETIVNAIEKVMFSEHYLDLCRNANNRVKDFTWENYVNMIINKMNKLKKSSV